MQSMRAIRRIIMVLAVATATVVVPAASNAAIVVPPPEGPWGYTSGLYVDGGQQVCNFYRVALGNGVAELVGAEVPCVDGLTFSPAGVLYAYTVSRGNGPITESELVTIDPGTGAQTVVGQMGRGFYEGGMTFDKDGQLWLYAEPDDSSCTDASSYNCLYSVNPGTGATTLVGGSTGVRGFVATGLAADCTSVYATGTVASGIQSDSLYAIDTTSGAVAPIGSLGTSMFTVGLDFASDGTLYTLAEPNTKGPLYWAPLTATLSTATGAASDVQTWASDDTTPNIASGLAIAGVTCAPAPAPEPIDVEPNFTG